MLRKPQVWIGIIISALALYWSFLGIDWPTLSAALRGARYGYLIPSALALIVAMVIRAERWRWLFGTRRADVPFGASFSAVAIGYLITNTVPLRAGEVARAIFISRGANARGAKSRGTEVGLAHAAATIVVEHVLDVFTVLGILVALLPFLPLPSWAAQGAGVVSLLFGGALIVMLLMVHQRIRIERWAERRFDRIPWLSTNAWLQHVRQVLDGFAVLRSGPPLIAAVLLSILAWLAAAATIHLALMAFVPRPDPIVSLFVTVTTTFSLLVPATPAGIGVLQGAIVLSLAVFDIPHATALSFAIVFHVMELVVMDVLGAVALWREAGSWAALKSQVRSVTEAA